MPPKKTTPAKTATSAKATAPAKKAAPKASAAATRAVTAFEERFKKSFGEGTLERSDVINPYEVISTGSLALDYALGVGGFVEGRLNEIWGPEGIGKTRILLLHLAAAQRKHPEKYVALIDVEQKVDKKWAADHGVDLTRFYLYHPKVAEDVADALKDMIRSGIMSAIGLDSIGAMVPKAEVDKNADESAMGKQAGIITRMVKIATAEAPQYGVAVTFINQVRANLAYGADTTTGGGFALKHATTHKLKVKRTSTTPFKAKVNGEEVIVGHEIAVVVERNGVAPAYRTATLVWYNQDTEKYGPMGIDVADEAFTLGLRTRVIRQAGAYYDMPDGHRYQGREAAVAAIRGDLTLQEDIREKVLATVASTIREEEETSEETQEDGPVDTTDVDTTERPVFRTSGKIAESDS